MLAHQNNEAVTAYQNSTLDKQLKCWLRDRKYLLKQYFAIAKTTSFDNEDTFAAIQVFCQRLMDYVSVGHFVVFDALREHYYQVKGNDAPMSALPPGISISTEHFVDFNDKYASVAACAENAQGLEEDFARIGEWLDDRIALEDRLMHALYTG